MTLSVRSGEQNTREDKPCGTVALTAVSDVVRCAELSRDFPPVKAEVSSRAGSQFIQEFVWVSLKRHSNGIRLKQRLLSHWIKHLLFAELVLLVAAAMSALFGCEDPDTWRSVYERYWETVEAKTNAKKGGKVKLLNLEKW